MGNNFIKKNYEESPWLVTRRTGNMLRLWAEVFHVSSSGSGTVKWQQISDDLVPVSLTCVQDSPQYVFQVTAYNSQVDKILDVRLTQPGTRIGQASECFVYWKDAITGDTWGLNFTSPMDARQFREVCSPSFKYSRKNNSSYSLKDKKQRAAKNKKPVSTPSSPSANNKEPQCTCMTNEQYARLRNQDRFKGSSTLPRMQTVPTSGRSTPGGGSQMGFEPASSCSSRPPNMSSQYASMRAGSRCQAPLIERSASAQPPCVSHPASAAAPNQPPAWSAGAGRARGNGRLGARGRRDMLLAASAARSVDLTNAELARQMRCRSSDDITAADCTRRPAAGDQIAPPDSPVTSPDIPRRHGPQPAGYPSVMSVGMESGRYGARPDGYMSEPEIRRRPRYLELQEDSPASDNYRFANLCYATTPSSSNSELDVNADTEPNSPTYTRLLLEYERHLRSTLARGDDAESYSLHTFEAMISQSNENLAAGPGGVSRSNTLPSRVTSTGAGATWRPVSHMPYRTAAPVSSAPRMSRPTDQERQGTLRRRGSLSRQDSVRSAQGVHSSAAGVGGRGEMATDQSETRLTQHRSLISELAHVPHLRQTSVESTGGGPDSKFCYLTSSEMSDDERMSLTTVVSDEEDDADSLHAFSPYNLARSATSSASFNCTGAVRKAGFLSVKKWLLRKKQQVELAKKRGWRGYWVCLKGTTLLFYPCESHEGRSIEQAPKHLIIVDGAIMQAIPEHPKRENVFCLSTAFGDAYLFQAPCQSELEGWINSIHGACAAAFARHRGKTGTLHLLQEEIFRLERSIEAESKLKHMVELQLSVATDADVKTSMTLQICSHEESSEKLHCEQFRLRCYMASLQGGELPNPKGLLVNVCRSTKLMLNRLGVFTVSSLHAYICARSPSLLNNLLAGRGATKRRAPMLSRCSSGAGSSRSTDHDSESDSQRNYRVRFHGNQFVTVHLKEGMTVEEFLMSACMRKNINSAGQFVRVKKRRDMETTNYFVPHRSDLIETYLQTHEWCEICSKVLFQVELSRGGMDQMWGFSVEAELVENSDRQDELCCYISRVEDISLAGKTGLLRGDEIMVINGAIVSDLDMMYIESVLQEELALCLMMRSSRTEVPDAGNLRRSTDEIIERLVCPPPPLECIAGDDDISSMIAPSVQTWKSGLTEGEGCPPPPSDISERSNVSTADIDNLLKSAVQVTGYCRSPADGGRGQSPTSSVASSQSQTPLQGRQLSHADKLRKVLLELISTERTYVQHLNRLIESYLDPLRRESFVSPAEISALFGNTPEIVQFQRDFLRSLEEALEMEPNLNRLESPTEFKNVLFSIGNAFLYHNNSFKLYSSFCASHSRAQKVLHPSEGNQQLQQFLQRQNPGQQHSSTLESYLIKPIQRILKYPLLLQQLKSLADPLSGEHHHLQEALKGMEKVAEHINEMQRIHEEYGAIFDHLFRQHQKTASQLLPVTSHVDLSAGELLYYGGVEWLNIADFLGKVKKGLELHAMCFVFKTAVVFLCKERLRQKKKLMSSSGKANPAEVEIIRYQSLVPVTEVQVRTSSGRDVESHFPWELIHLKSQIHRRNEKVYHLSNSSSDFRNAFLKTIRQIIRESVRNMSIPMTKPSGNQFRPGTLHHQRAVNMRKKIPNYATLQRHSAATVTKMSSVDYDNLESYQRHSGFVGSSNLRRRSHNLDTSGSISSVTSSQSLSRPADPALRAFGGAPLVVCDDGSDARDDTSRSDADEEVAAVTAASTSTLPPAALRRPPPVGSTSTGGQLGRVPHHLSLSTTSTLSTGSTSGPVVGSGQARLVQASNDPEHYQPPHTPAVGSPVWKPRTGPAGPLLHEARPAAGVGSTGGRTMPSHSSSTLPPPGRNGGLQGRSGGPRHGQPSAQQSGSSTLGRQPQRQDPSRDARARMDAVLQRLGGFS